MQLLNHFAAPVSGGIINAVIAGCPAGAADRLIKDDPVWRLGVLVDQHLYDDEKHHLRVSGKITFWMSTQ